MSKITKKQLHNGWHGHDTEIIKMKKELRELKQSVLRLEKLTDEKLCDQPKPQLKQLDQSVFDGLDEKWRFAAVDRGGLLKAFTYKPKLSVSMTSFILLIGNTIDIGTGYDPTNWQNSLIERESIELTGSELCKAMLKNQVYVPCFVSNVSEAHAIERKQTAMIDKVYSGLPFIFRSGYNGWTYAIPINNQGEPLTASEVGL